ncbi:HIRAN domain-containing protein [Rothia terrae]|uniref:HIRAN domain-containing protein n=1 Tax=Rothia terrae TaxID=396015 RepID=UPI003808BEC6
MSKIEVPREPHSLGIGQNISVVGTHYRADKIRLMGNLLYKEVSLVPEPDNPYDSNAISVRRHGIKIGYLSQYWAKRYTPKVQAIFAAGYLPTTSISEAKGNDIRIRIDKPHELGLYPTVLQSKKRYPLPKTYEVSGEFPLLLKAPKKKREKKSFLSFFKRKKNSPTK